MLRSLVIAVPLMLLAATVQSAVLTRLPLFGQVFQPVILIAISWGLLRGLSEGVAWGFMGGLALSLFSVGPAGGQALALMAAVSVAVAVRALLPGGQYLLPPLLGGAGTVIHLIISAGLAGLSGFTIPWSFVAELPLLFIVQAGLTSVIYWPLVGLDRLLNPTPITVQE